MELFGSSAMGLATKTSDLDIGMVRPGDDTVDIFKQPDAKKSKRPRRGKRGELSEDAKFLKIICKSLRRNPRGTRQCD